MYNRGYNPYCYRCLDCLPNDSHWSSYYDWLGNIVLWRNSFVYLEPWVWSQKEDSFTNGFSCFVFSVSRNSLGYFVFWTDLLFLYRIVVYAWVVVFCHRHSHLRMRICNYILCTDEVYPYYKTVRTVNYVNMKLGFLSGLLLYWKTIIDIYDEMII